MKQPPRSVRDAVRAHNVPPAFDSERTWGAVRARYGHNRRRRRLTKVSGTVLALAAALLLVVLVRDDAPRGGLAGGALVDSALVRAVSELESALAPMLASRDGEFRRQFAKDLEVVQGVLADLESYQPGSSSDAQLVAQQHARALNAKARLLRSITEAD